MQLPSWIFRIEPHPAPAVLRSYRKIGHPICSSVTVVGIEVNSMEKVSPNIVEILRSTLARVEQSTDLAPDDPARAELRHLVVRLIAELEVEKTRKTA